jgi:hypothetical protein
MSKLDLPLCEGAGNFWESLDGGATWEHLASLPEKPGALIRGGWSMSWAVDPADADHIIMWRSVHPAA